MELGPAKTPLSHDLEISKIEGIPIELNAESQRITLPLLEKSAPQLSANYTRT